MYSVTEREHSHNSTIIHKQGKKTIPYLWSVWMLNLDGHLRGYLTE